MNGTLAMNDDEENITYTPEELLETVLNIAASAVEQQFHDDTREALWAILDATAQAYGIEAHREFADTSTVPQGFPFRITDVTDSKDSKD